MEEDVDFEGIKQAQGQLEAERIARLGHGIAGYALHMAKQGRIGETGRVLSRVSIPRFRLHVMGRPVFDESVHGGSAMYHPAAYDAANAELRERGLVITPPGGVDADFHVRMSINLLETAEPTASQEQ